MPPAVSIQVLRTPELVQSICRYTTIGDEARLAQSDRRLFYMLMPALWEHVEGLPRLFALSPYLDQMSKDKRHTLNTSEGIDEFIGSHKPLDNDDLARFHIYSPWIKHLEVCKHGATPEYNAALSLLYISSNRRTILPNIVSISMTVHFNFRTNPIWVVPFLSDSLRELDFSITSSTENWNIPLTESKILLWLVSMKCFQLKIFCFTPPAVGPFPRPQPSITLLDTLTQRIHPNIKEQLDNSPWYFIASMQPLVRFATSASFLESSYFETISNWPSLEYFEVLFDTEDGLDLPDFAGNAFPALIHLGLHRVPGWDTAEEIWDTSSLVSKLTSIKINMAMTCIDRENESGDEVISLLNALATGSPHVRNLWFHVDSGYNFHAYEIFASELHQLEGLSLIKLHLGGIAFNDDSEAVPRHIAAIFPAIKELGLPKHQIESTELQLFLSELPLLEVLRIEFALESISTAPKIDLSSVPRYRSVPLHTLEANLIGDTKEEVLSDVLSLNHFEAKTFSEYVTLGSGGYIFG
ncbi:hypothetical protein RhiJN_18300 [Ceratobasidium sp. AG-Ba]|nr:hypothetical protein RhiJN_18300 [Ceratobasidium sp. AG-Ba]